MSYVKDSLIGLAIGDAMGVPIEFSVREKCFENPLTEMIGFGSHDVPAGSWSDDTSMTIATIDSYIENKSFNYKDIMEKWYQWLVDYKYTPCNYRFDIGYTCFEAIYNYSKKDIEPLKCGLTDIKSNGNGSLMRILPVALYSYYKNLKDEQVIELTNNISSLTHAHQISKLGCYIYVRFVMLLLSEKDKFTAYNMLKKLDYSYYSKGSIKTYERILNNDINKIELNNINSSGYIVDTLEASMWVLLNTDSFSQAIIGAINLGEDTDTVGAVTGSMAGIIYGYDNIPKIWLNKLLKLDYLENLCDKFEKALK